MRICFHVHSSALNKHATRVLRVARNRTQDKNSVAANMQAKRRAPNSNVNLWPECCAGSHYLKQERRQTWKSAVDISLERYEHAVLCCCLYMMSLTQQVQMLTADSMQAHMVGISSSGHLETLAT